MNNTNTTKKYELLKDDTKQLFGLTLYRIRALVAIGSMVDSGELGGYVEKEANLSHYGNAWVYGDAWVYRDARVSGDARVYGNARVYGDAKVYGDARVSGDAKVYGDAWVYRDAKVYGDARVSGDAKVYGDARVSGDARVYGDARVSGDARVYGDAWVYGNAWVYGDAWVYGNARVSGDARVENYTQWLLAGPAKSSGRFTTAFKDSKLGVRVVCGCFTGSVKEFSDQIEKTHKENKEYLEQYRLFCQLIAFNFGVEA